MNAKIIELATKFKALKLKSAEQETALKDTNNEWTDIELQLIDAMIEEGVKSISIEGLGAYTLRATNYLSVNAANKPGFYQYLKDSGNGALLKEEVNPKTLTAFLGRHLEEIQTSLMKEKSVDEITARNEALELLKAKGASYFTKRDIALKSN